MEQIFAEKIAKEQKAVSVAEFFEKNRHLLGFGSKRQAMLTVVKEAVDNSLDACEEMGELPTIKVEIKEVGAEKYKIAVQDNGPGIVKENIGKAFGKLLYGSKFHGNRQGRGQQGIGITSCVLYSQLTTGKHTKVISKIHSSKPAHYINLVVDTKNNEPLILEEGTVDSYTVRGTRIELEISGEFINKGKQSVEEYLKRTSIVNPHAKIIFVKPTEEKSLFERTSSKLPRTAKKIKPHPDGLELGILIKMLLNTNAKSVRSFLTTEFSSIGSKTAEEILKKCSIDNRVKPDKLSMDKAEELLKAMQTTPIHAPPLDCLSPIGEEALLKSMKSEIEAEFYTTITRKPTAYRGMPFLVEVGLAYGGSLPIEEKVNIMRFSNKVPLIYEDYACAITEAIKDVAWKRYGLDQPGGFPKGPLIILVHMASVWVPFTSEGKQAIASYPEIIKEMKLAIMEAARKMQLYISKKTRARLAKQKLDTFVKYSREVVTGISELADIEEKTVKNVMDKLLINKFGEDNVNSIKEG